jgi:uncharacterized protein YtpQ (UPF0354 family)
MGVFQWLNMLNYINGSIPIQNLNFVYYSNKLIVILKAFI